MTAKVLEFLATTADPSARRHPAAPLVASLIIHAAMVAALFTLSFPDEIAERPPRMRAVTLLAPVPLAVRAAAPMPAETARARPNPLPRADPTTLRRFRPPTVSPTPAPHGELLPTPAIDIPRLVLPVLELAHIAAALAPPLKTDNLAAPRVAAPAAAPSAVVQPAGFAAATSAATRTLGSLRPTGFESASTAIDATPRRPTPPLSRAGFGDASFGDPLGDPTHGAVSATAAPLLTRPVEILSKPKPAYTEEARRRQIEGEVLLEILFSASGQVRVVRTVRGLGQGLDESAVAAAEAIRFRPAERAGVPADSTAIVHIVFQLAY